MSECCLCLFPLDFEASGSPGPLDCAIIRGWYFPVLPYEWKRRAAFPSENAPLWWWRRSRCLICFEVCAPRLISWAYRLRCALMPEPLSILIAYVASAPMVISRPCLPRYKANYYRRRMPWCFRSYHSKLLSKFHSFFFPPAFLPLGACK